MCRFAATIVGGGDMKAALFFLLGVMFLLLEFVVRGIRPARVKT
jgi:hypothetical protein